MVQSEYQPIKNQKSILSNKSNFTLWQRERSLARQTGEYYLHFYILLNYYSMSMHLIHQSAAQKTNIVSLNFRIGVPSFGTDTYVTHRIESNTISMLIDWQIHRSSCWCSSSRFMGTWNPSWNFSCWVERFLSSNSSQYEWWLFSSFWIFDTSTLHWRCILDNLFNWIQYYTISIRYYVFRMF